VKNSRSLEFIGTSFRAQQMINTRRAKLALPLPSVQSGLILTAVDPPKGAWKLKTTNYDYHLSHRSGCDWSGLKKWSCCSITNQCGENEGDCDSDTHCLNDLKCGTENCVGPHFNPLADCCFRWEIFGLWLLLFCQNERS
jgi:hypothetical protein